jgi:hypothetical protein
MKEAKLKHKVNISHGDWRNGLLKYIDWVIIWIHCFLVPYLIYRKCVSYSAEMFKLRILFRPSVILHWLAISLP